MCPPPDAKAKKSTEYVESKGVLAEKYDILLHFPIAHMLCVDCALPEPGPGGSYDPRPASLMGSNGPTTRAQRA